MAHQSVNGVKLFYEVAGRGEPLVLVHGSWGDHHVWDELAALLLEHHTVVTYDRRGHSQSEAGPGQGSFAEDAEDLAGLIEALGLGPAFVVGNSGGAAISLRLAATRPELIRKLAVHEPPLLRLLEGRPEHAPLLDGFGRRVAPVVELLRAGQMEAAARQFVETVAFGPGAWATLPEPVRQTFIHNAPTFLDESNDPEGLNLDLVALRGFDKPALMTRGTASPPFFEPIAERVAASLPHGRLQVLDGVGHVPHLSHPRQYLAVLRGFIGGEAREEPAHRA